MSTAGSRIPESSTATLAARLEGLLTAEPYRLEKVEKVTDLWRSDVDTTGRARLIVEPRLRIAQYLDLDPALVIADVALGTLGLVFHLDQDVKKSSEQILDKATYLRHLLLMEAGVDARPARRACSVECVLLLSSQERQDELKQVFRTTARETSFWHAIGVNMLVCPEGTTPSPESLRRAFSWLLAATRRWFLDRPRVPERRLRKVTLRNYRLPGHRVWTFEPGAAVHLLHGQNGTGKSSFAEALELSVTGKVVRLATRNAVNYDAVIKNRGSSKPASIKLEFDRHDPWISSVQENGVGDPLKHGIPVSSFRLDQDAMDDLARKGPSQRAEVFLGSFFPADRGVTLALNQARTTLDARIRMLPAHIQSELQSLAPDQRAERIQSQFAWVTTARPPTGDEAKVYRPLSNDSLRALRLLSSEIAQYIEKEEFESAIQFEQILNGLNEALERLRRRAGGLLDAIATARQSLGEETIRRWQPRSRASAMHEWLALLEQFSENIALADLAEKHLHVSETLADAANQGWVANTELQAPAGLFVQPPETIAASLDDLRKLRDDLANRRKALSEQLVHSTQTELTDATQPAARPDLSARQVRAFNLAGEALAPAAPEPLGRVLEQAFIADATAQFGDVTVGESEDWAARLDEKLGAIQSALAALHDEAYIGPVKRRDDLKAIVEDAKAVASARANVNNMFLTELQNERFNDALNELMALFTPARWAYDDVAITRGFDAGKETMELDISGAKGSSADLLFNTAELNVFTLAMYVLAAVRTENPLGILLFDDPLQNMDELTVTTVARGLAKVAAIFPTGWELVFLFHGEDDLERFRQEIPAAVYLLPWLTPSADASDEVTIGDERLKSTFDWQLQELANVIVTRAGPASAAS